MGVASWYASQSPRNFLVLAKILAVKVNTKIMTTELATIHLSLRQLPLLREMMN